jgi:cytochrome P450
MTQYAREYGDFVRFHLGPFPVYLASNPDVIESVLGDNTGLFVRARNAQSIRSLVGNGMVTSAGSFWQRQRRLLQPAFHRQQIVASAEQISTITERVINEQWQEGEVYEIDHQLVGLTMAIVGKTLFDVDVTDAIDTIGKAMEVAVRHFEIRSSNMFIIPEWLPTIDNLRYRKAVQDMNRIVFNIIEEHKNNPCHSRDLLSVLLSLQDEDGTKMTDRQVRDEVMTFILAGHETSAHSLAWTCWLLAEHPDIEAKLVSEIESVLGGRSPTYEDLANLKYTEAILLEAMRLYPAAWLLAREAVQDCEVAGYQIKAGETIFMSPWVMHRDSRFFEQPEVFNPSRWSGDFIKHVHPCVYFPFGQGPRMCIGKSFAMMEMILILASIFQKFHMKLIPGQNVEVNPSMTLYPKNGIQIVLKKR